MSLKPLRIYKYLFLLTLVVTTMVPFGFLYAADVADFATPDPSGYVRLAPLPTPKITVGTGLAGYLQTLFWLAITFAGVLAVLMITLGGIQYMASEAFGTKAAAKNQITMAIVGFLLAISSVLILTTINPDLLKFNLVVRKLTFEIPPGLPSGSIPGCTNFALPPVNLCAWIDKGVYTEASCSRIVELGGSNGNYWADAPNDSYCAQEKPKSVVKCCQYIIPKNGCSAEGQLAGRAQCQWSIKASAGDNCTETEGMPSGFTKTGTENFCSGPPPINESLFQTSSDCCVK